MNNRMLLSWSNRCLAASLLAVFALASAPVAGQEEPNSFESLNYPQHYIRHRLSLGYIDKIVASDSLGRKDGTFRVVRGLAGRCSSFESVNYPGHFLRHQNYRLKLARREDTELFKADATFCVKQGLFNSGFVSFESFNFPGHYIRHSNFELWIARSDGSTLFRKDATFRQAPALTTHGPSVPFDDGTNLVPADHEQRATPGDLSRLSSQSRPRITEPGAIEPDQGQANSLATHPPPHVGSHLAMKGATARGIQELLGHTKLATTQRYMRLSPAAVEEANSGRWQVSTGGGTRPLWARSGKELFYLGPSGVVMSTSVEGGSTFRAGNPTRPFEGPYSYTQMRRAGPMTSRGTEN